MSSSTSSGSSLDVSDIVGIVIGGVLGLATVIGLIFSIYALCGKKKTPTEVWPQHPSQYPPYSGYGQPTNTGYYSQQPPYQQLQQPPSNRQPTIPEQPPAYSSVDPGSSAYGNYKH
jgi:hypothetical protein